MQSLKGAQTQEGGSPWKKPQQQHEEELSNAKQNAAKGATGACVCWHQIITLSVGLWHFALSLNVSLLDASLLEMPTNDLCLSLRMSVHFPGLLQFVLSPPTCSSNF